MLSLLVTVWKADLCLFPKTCGGVMANVYSSVKKQKDFQDHGSVLKVGENEEKHDWQSAKSEFSKLGIHVTQSKRILP